MNSSIARAGLLALAMIPTGCSDHKAAIRQASKPTPGKSTDPTVWNENDVTKDGAAGSTPSGLANSSRMSGGWSDEARDVERNLGVSR